MDAPIDISGVQLETERLLLRPWRMEDAEDMYAYARTEEVGPMAGWVPHCSLERSKEIVAMFMRGKNTFALEHKETGKVIGSIGIDELGVLPGKEYEPLLGREIGYVLSKEYWGRGLMSEAVRRVIHYCFEELSLDFLTVSHFSWNQQSRRVIEKCGFDFCSSYSCTTDMGKKEENWLYVLRNPHRFPVREEKERIYPATEVTAEKAAELALLLWPSHTMEELKAEIHSLLARQDALVLLAFCEGTAVGYAQCQLRRDYVEGTSSSPVGYLEGVFVREEYRGKGIARRLLDSCEGWAKQCGCQEFASDCELENVQSLNFHLHCGFSEANRIICFQKRL